MLGIKSLFLLFSGMMVIRLRGRGGHHGRGGAGFGVGGHGFGVEGLDFEEVDGNTALVLESLAGAMDQVLGNKPLRPVHCGYYL